MIRMIRRSPRSPLQHRYVWTSISGAWGLAGLVSILIAHAAATGPAWAITIDDFTTSQATQTLIYPADTTSSSSVSGTGILGGERDIEVDLTGGSTVGNSISAGVAGGIFSQSQDATISGISRIVWDGTDGSPTVNPTGLGSIDLTTGGTEDAFLINVASSDSTFSATLAVWSDASHASTLSFQLQGPVASPTLFVIPYAAFSPLVGTGANFAQVGAISLTVMDSSSSRLALGPFQTTTTLAASKTVALGNDVNGDGQANPGDTLLYTVVLSYTNSVVVEVHGRTATSVTYTNAIPAYTTLVVGSVTTSQGVVTSGNNTGDTSVAVSVGTMNLFPAVTIQFAVTVNNPFPFDVTQVSCQGAVASDTLTGLLTDDPNLPGPSDPTTIPIIQALPPAAAIPTLDEWGLLALALALAGLGLTRLRRQGTRPDFSKA
jgi:hypothetical protein